MVDLQNDDDRPAIEAVQVHVSAFAVWGVTTDRFIVELGGYELLIGRSADAAEHRILVTVDGGIVEPRSPVRGFLAASFDDSAATVIMPFTPLARDAIALAPGSNVGQPIYREVEPPRGRLFVESRATGRVSIETIADSVWCERGSSSVDSADWFYCRTVLAVLAVLAVFAVSTAGTAESVLPADLRLTMTPGVEIAWIGNTPRQPLLAFP